MSSDALRAYQAAFEDSHPYPPAEVHLARLLVQSGEEETGRQVSRRRVWCLYVSVSIDY